MPKLFGGWEEAPATLVAVTRVTAKKSAMEISKCRTSVVLYLTVTYATEWVTVPLY
jgi:hypothetical protein